MHVYYIRVLTRLVRVERSDLLKQNLEVRHAILISENLSVAHVFDQSFRGQGKFPHFDNSRFLYCSLLIMSIKVFYITRERH